MGVFGTIWDSGGAAGPILAGFLIARLSYFNAFLIISALIAIAASIFAVGTKDPSKPSTKQVEAKIAAAEGP